MLTRVGFLLFCLALGAILPFLTVTAQSDISQKAHDLHFSSVVVDTHDDTTQRLLDPKFDFGIRHNDGSIDILRMREGNLSAIFFSIWISGTITGPEAVKRAMDQIDVVRELPVRYSKDIARARTADDVRRIHADGKIAALMGVEGGHMIDNDLGVLRDFARLGVRYMTLTHMVDTDWADSSTGKSTHNGLTDFGKQVVREMNRMGIMVDISHVSDKTFYDALAISEAPMIASHSSCRAICDAPRNMTDDMIKALAAKGGVIQINYHVGFLSQEFKDANEKVRGDVTGLTDRYTKECGQNLDCQVQTDDRVYHQMEKEGKL